MFRYYLKEDLNKAEHYLLLLVISELQVICNLECLQLCQNGLVHPTEPGRDRIIQMNFLKV